MFLEVRANKAPTSEKQWVLHILGGYYRRHGNHSDLRSQTLHLDLCESVLEDLHGNVRPVRGDATFVTIKVMRWQNFHLDKRNLDILLHHSALQHVNICVLACDDELVSMLMLAFSSKHRGCLTEPIARPGPV